MKKIISILALLMIFFAFSCKKEKTVEETFTQFPSPDWKIDQTGKYPVSMTAVVALPEKLKRNMLPDDKLGAFIKDECRGVGVLVKVNANASVYYVLVHGTASEIEKVQFKYYNTQTSYMYNTSAFLTFAMDGNYGTVDAPAILDLQGVH